jgi:hypothetical protein
MHVIAMMHADTIHRHVRIIFACVAVKQSLAV